MFAKKVFVQVERKTQHVNEKQIWDRIAGDLEILDLRNTFGKITQSRRKPRGQKKDRNRGRKEKVPEDEPVTAFEIGIGLFSLIARNTRQPCLCRRSRISWSKILSGRVGAVAGVVDPGSVFEG